MWQGNMCNVQAWQFLTECLLDCRVGNASLYGSQAWFREMALLFGIVLDQTPL